MSHARECVAHRARAVAALGMPGAAMVHRTIRMVRRAVTIGAVVSRPTVVTIATVVSSTTVPTRTAVPARTAVTHYWSMPI